MFNRKLAPTAAPLRFHVIVSELMSTSAPGKDRLAFSRDISAYMRSKHVFLLSSGKAALAVALAVLKKTSPKREVIAPAYSSFCLASALARANVRVRLCDVDPATLDFDYDKLHSLVNQNTLAIIPVHLFGIVCNMSRIRELAANSGARIIEDAAQAFGASYEGRKTGTLGDIGILSFGRGKNLFALGGGAILTDDDNLAVLIGEEVGRLLGLPVPAVLKSAAAGLATSLFINPRLYAIPSALPFLNLGANVYHPGFEIGLLPALNAGIGRRTFSSLDTINNIRIKNAHILSTELETASVSLPKPNPQGRSVFLRYPLLFPDNSRRESVLEKLSALGLGPSGSYPLPLNEVSGFDKHLAGQGIFPGAKKIADTILTLPTHPYVRRDELQKICELVQSCVR